MRPATINAYYRDLLVGQLKTFPSALPLFTGRRGATTKKQNEMQSQPTIKTPIAGDILSHLSPQAVETLAEFETTVDSETRDNINALPDETDFDRLWLPLLALRIYRGRAYQHWATLLPDPRFPNFRKVNFGDMFALTAWDCRPAEAVTQIVKTFAPAGYNAGWIVERLSGYTSATAA